MRLRNLYLIFTLLVVFSFTSCKQVEHTTAPKTEVLVLGTIHSGHLTDSICNVAYLDKLIRNINPDYILAEIPPDRFENALEGFKRDDSISEPRVLRFPEYVDVVFPLTKELDFEIIPTAGWTAPMARERSAKLRAISKDSSRIKDWTSYISANRRSDSIYKATGKVNDPYFIHTNTCLLYTSPSPRDKRQSRMPSSA